MMTLDAPTRAWVAGFFDGEGCVHISVRNGKAPLPQMALIVAVGNTDRRAVDMLCRLFEGSTRRAYVHKNHPRRIYEWRLHGERAAAFCREMLPYAVVKREQMELAVSFWGLPWRLTSRKGVDTRGRKRTGDQVVVELDHARKLAELKRAG